MPTIFLPYIVSIFAVLAGIVWNNLNEKIKVIQENERTCPIHKVGSDIATMKNDIAWLKEFLQKENK